MQTTCELYMRIIHANYTCEVYKLIIHANYTCSLYMLIVHAHYTCSNVCQYTERNALVTATN